MSEPEETDLEVDPELEHYLNMSDEEVTLAMARAGISPLDADRMFDRMWASVCAHFAARDCADVTRWEGEGGLRR